MDKGKRLEKAMTELLSATQAIHGKDVAITVVYDTILRSNSRDDVTEFGIDDILGDDIDGNV